MNLRSETFTRQEKDEQLRSLDGCICRICVSDDPLEIVRMLGFANHYLGMLAQNRMLQLKETKENDVAEIENEWISVEDKLPQENEKVLAINSDGEIFIATYLVHKVSPSARGYKTWASGLWNGTPTHWQPLPQPPKMRGE